MVKRQKLSHSPSSDDEPVRLAQFAPVVTGITNSGSSADRPMNPLPQRASHPRPGRQLFICGAGDYGQLGMGTSVEATRELRRPRSHVSFELAMASNMLGDEPQAGIERAVAGGMHSLVVDEAGRVWSFGVNDEAALGRVTESVPDPDEPSLLIETDVLEFQPMVIPSLAKEGFRAVHVAAGDSVSVFLDDKGALRACGCFRASDGILGFRPWSVIERARAKSNYISVPQLNPITIPAFQDERFTQVACGSNHVLALTQYGVVYCWGNGQHGELGRMIVERHKISALRPSRLLIQRIVHVAAGAFHSFALSENGVVYAWGLNSYGQTGISAKDIETEDTTVVWKPTEVAALNPSNLGRGRRVVQICAGEHHSLFLLNDGTVYGCGRCGSSELGLGLDHPSLMSTPSSSVPSTPALSPTTDDSSSTIFSPSFSSVNSFSYMSSPTVIRFPPPPTPTDPDPPVPPFGHPSAPNPISRISANARHSFAVSRAGHVYSWGLGQTGELGLGEIVEQATPKRVRNGSFNELRADRKGWKWVVEDVSTGGQHTLIVARLSP